MTSTTYLRQSVSCDDCGFSTRDVALFNNHSCDVQAFGGQCEDFPCCGHERGDCNGLLYGSDEAIKSDPHLLCDHNTGTCEVYYDEEPDDCPDDHDCLDCERPATAASRWHCAYCDRPCPEGAHSDEYDYF